MVITITEDEYGDYIVQVTGGDSREFFAAIEQLKLRIPRHMRRYDPDAKEWCITSRLALERWLDYARALGADVDWESERRRQQPPPPPPPPPPRSPRDNAFTTMYLLPNAPPEVIKASYKALALLHHPDRGGDLENRTRANSTTGFKLQSPL
ncbi:MAG: J domain-containing protein [Acidobacteria bacterium]|nr:J domain-containing protein [Acidobacteriota bacterium]